MKDLKITLQISDADAADFVRKCFRDGTNPAEVLEAFINDLIDGTRTRGSDERRLAAEYYDRLTACSPSGTFAQWLIDEENLNSFILQLEDLEALEEDLRELKENPHEAHKGEIRDIIAEISNRKDEITDIYNDYAEITPEPEPLEEAIKGAKDCYNSINDYMKGGI